MLEILFLRYFSYIDRSIRNKSRVVYLSDIWVVDKVLYWPYDCSPEIWDDYFDKARKPHDQMNK
jgi:hypothetical protein